MADDRVGVNVRFQGPANRSRTTALSNKQDIQAVREAAS
jgi:hypothetical protein